jgi:molybdate transport system regulatory protein
MGKSLAGNLEISEGPDSFWLNKDKIHFLGSRRIGLLEKIDELGSLSQAARAVKLSYKTAWSAINSMNQISDSPLVVTMAGGKDGGGSRVTALGKELIHVFRLVEKEHESLVQGLSKRVQDFESFYRLIGRISMKISARNQFFGKIRKVQKGAVNAEIEIVIDKQNSIIAIITNASVEELDLKKGVEAYALIKANLIILAKGMNGVKTSARNTLCGKVTRIVQGAVNSEVTIEFAAGKTVTAVITKESQREMGLRVGINACAIFKASSVIVGIRGS